MSAPVPAITGKAAELRLAFDRAFAEPTKIQTDTREALLAIRVGAEPYAIRLSEISGLYADRKITPVPGSAASLLGIAGFRGAIVPVYRLRALLGVAEPASDNGAAPRWLVIAAAAPVALAFEGFDGQRRVPHDAIVARPHGGRAHAHEFARSRKFAGAILHLPSLLETIYEAKSDVGLRTE
jgi:purine-binding chemotaxis protein CheW